MSDKEPGFIFVLWIDRQSPLLSVVARKPNIPLACLFSLKELSLPLMV